MGWSRRGFLLHLVSILLLPNTPRVWANESRRGPWHMDYLRAQRLRATANRPMLVFLTMDGCPYCHKMMQTTYEQAGVASEAAETFVLALINGSKQKALAKQFGVRIYPTTYLVDSDNRLVDRIEGFVPPDQLRERLATASRRLATDSTPQTPN
jgi:thioredoxin-like negative regulator of GroEL